MQLRQRLEFFEIGLAYSIWLHDAFYWDFCFNGAERVRIKLEFHLLARTAIDVSITWKKQAKALEKKILLEMG